MITELPAIPQWTLNNSQGRIGTRTFLLENEDVEAFVGRLCASTWPGHKHCLPINIAVGPWDENLKFTGDASLDKLPHYPQTKVVAQYQYLMLEAPWPKHYLDEGLTPKHPEGTTLSMRVQGSGQFLTMPGTAFHTKNDGPVTSFTQSDNCRIVIPLTEYHLECDRLKASQVPGDWKHREGTVNSDVYLGENPETLLFDTWKLDPSFVPAVRESDMVRYKLSCVLRSRDIPIQQAGLKYAHWNTDYHDKRWVKVYITEGDTDRPRYPLASFEDLFTSGVDGAAKPDWLMERFKTDRALLSKRQHRRQKQRQQGKG